MPLSTQQQERLERLKVLVTYRVDEYSEAADNIGSDTINFGDLDSELHGAARKVLTSISRFDSFRSAVKADSFVGPVQDASKQCTYIPLPEDFLRFVSVKLNTWKTSSTGLIADNSSAYRQQIYPQYRGTAERPKAFKVPYFNGTYNAGVVPAQTAYCKLATIEAGGTVNIGDTVTLSAFSGVIEDTSDPDYIIVTDPGTILTVGETLTSSGAASSYTLTVMFVAGNTFTRPTHKDALELYPKGTSITEFVYVPWLKAYDIPDYLEDALVWYTCYRMLLINERFEGAKAAENEFVKAVQFLNQGMKGEEGGQSS